MVTWTPVRATIPATIRPAMGSNMGAPHIEPTMAIRATTDDTASVRWCQAFAIRTWELRRFPTAFVVWVGVGLGVGVEGSGGG